MADEGFLQRWSRRKAEARAPREEPEPAAAATPLLDTASPPGAVETPAAAPLEARSRDEPLAAVDLAALPDIDSLTYESDFTVFLRKGVPPELRRRALQRLWRCNPTLANLDGLVDYAEDYNRSGTAPEVVRTAYQVGRGMLERVAAPPSGEGGAPAAVGAARAAPAKAS